MAKKQVRFSSPRKTDPRMMMDEDLEPRVKILEQNELTICDSQETSELMNRSVYQQTFNKLQFSRANLHNHDNIVLPTSELDLSLYDADELFHETPSVNLSQKSKPVKKWEKSSSPATSFFFRPGEEEKPLKNTTVTHNNNTDIATDQVELSNTPKLLQSDEKLILPMHQNNLQTCVKIQHMVKKPLSCLLKHKNFIEEFYSNSDIGSQGFSMCSHKENISSICCCKIEVCRGTKKCHCAVRKEIKRTPAEIKTHAIDQYLNESNSHSNTTKNRVQEKKEPTIKELFKIVKLQNEKLQLLQEKVDKFVDSHDNSSSIIAKQIKPVNTLHNEKKSVGVLTSFEMLRTSTYTTREVKLTAQNVQIQCNKSEISVREVYGQPVTQNIKFLEGISPVCNKLSDSNRVGKSESANDATVNELSLANFAFNSVQSQKGSPHLSSYLEGQDLSKSENDEPDKVGWTYYNNVMNHVDEILEEQVKSPCNVRQSIPQPIAKLQVDSANVSMITSKRVTFNKQQLLSTNNNPASTQNNFPATKQTAHINTDVSMQMNRLALRYLGNKPRKKSDPTTTPNQSRVQQEVRRSLQQNWNHDADFDGMLQLSTGTRDYMAQHRILEASGNAQQSKFLDITALKQQPKLL